MPTDLVPAESGAVTGDDLAVSAIGMTLPASRSSLKLSCSMEVKPHLEETATFWRPGNLNLARRRASTAVSFRRRRVRMDLRRGNEPKQEGGERRAQAAYLEIC